MAHYLIGNVETLSWVAAKAVTLFLTVVLGFRLIHRRSLADLSVIDFIAAVAVGSIVGRVPNASDTTYLQGAVTIAAVFGTHYVLSVLRLSPRFATLIEHRALVIVRDGAVDDAALRRAALTPADLRALLRERGIASVDDVRFAILERRGAISVLRMSEVPPGRTERGSESTLADLPIG